MEMNPYTRGNQWQNKAEDWKVTWKRMVEITAARQTIEKRIKKENEDNLRDLWDTKHLHERDPS